MSCRFAGLKVRTGVQAGYLRVKLEDLLVSG